MSTSRRHSSRPGAAASCGPRDPEWTTARPRGPNGPRRGTTYPRGSRRTSNRAAISWNTAARRGRSTRRVRRLVEGVNVRAYSCRQLADCPMEDEVMRRTNVVALALSVIVCALMITPSASAQQATASGIAGVVKDTSGAVLPGVTVEAASPALIERVRSVVSDSEGRYNIVDLRPGSYTVTLHPDRLQHFQAGRHRAAVGVHGDGERGPAGRGGRRDDYGDGRGPAGRHAERPQADRGLERPAQHAAEQREEPEQPRGAHARVSRQRRIRRHRRLQRPNRRHVPRQGGHQRPVRRHGDPTCVRQSGLQRQRGDGDGTGDVDDRHHRRQQCRRRHREHDSQGGRQQVQRRQQRSLLRART